MVGGECHLALAHHIGRNRAEASGVDPMEKENARPMWKLLTIILASLITFGLIAAGYAWYIFRGLTDKERERLRQRE
jgi:hypothetical protein